MDSIFRQIYGTLIAVYLHNLSKCIIQLQCGYTAVTVNWFNFSVNKVSRDSSVSGDKLIAGLEVNMKKHLSYLFPNAF